VKAIFNASPIIALLDEIQEPGIFTLLKRLDWELLVPAYVIRCEILKPPACDALVGLLGKGILTQVADPPDEEIELFLSENPDLDKGESCVLLWSVELKGKSQPVVAILDEGPARKKASALNVHRMGTIGILRLLTQRKLISELEATRMGEILGASSFRVAKDLLPRKEERVG
jgi:predicted nucleic acid-binding protein